MRTGGTAICLAGSCFAAALILFLLPAASSVTGSPLVRSLAAFTLIALPVFVATKIAYRSGVESQKPRQLDPTDRPDA